LKLKKIAELDLPAKDLSAAGDIIVEPKDIPGPTALIRGEKIEASIEASIEAAKEKILKYIKKAEKDISFKITEI
jgi:hypothetical protein